MRNHSSKYLSGTRSLNERFSLYGLFTGRSYHSPQDIKGIDMISTDQYVCHVKCDGRNVYSAHKFTPGDIIEFCPCRSVDKQSLYSKDVRDMVFEVEPNEKYVIPMGYCQYYDLGDNYGKTPNCDYEWDSDRECIVIRATRKIQKGDLLIINIER